MTIVGVLGVHFQDMCYWGIFLKNYSDHVIDPDFPVLAPPVSSLEQALKCQRWGLEVGGKEGFLVEAPTSTGQMMNMRTLYQNTHAY